MKAVPILILTNALALGLVILLYVQQQDLKAQVGSQRSETYRGGVVDTAGIDSRIERLERMLTVREEPPAARAAAPGPSHAGALPEEAADLSPTVGPEGGEPPGAEYDPVEMEVFRKKVRRANDLNRAEEEVGRVVERLDELVQGNRIAPLTKPQKDKIASTILYYREQVPNVFRRLRENGTLQNASREDRGQIMRTEFESLRAEAQKSMEDLIPAVDAKTILEEVAGPGDFRGGFGFGAPGRPQRGSDGGR